MDIREQQVEVVCYKRSNVETIAQMRKPGYLAEVLRCNTSDSPIEICIPKSDAARIKKDFSHELSSPLANPSSVAQSSQQENSRQLPSIMQMAKNLANAAGEEVKAIVERNPPVSDEEYNRRIEICRTCPHFTPNNPDLPERARQQERCTLCGCYMKYKSKLRSQHCPEGKW